jgi:hypothetical protein
MKQMFHGVSSFGEQDLTIREIHRRVRGQQLRISYRKMCQENPAPQTENKKEILVTSRSLFVLTVAREKRDDQRFRSCKSAPVTKTTSALGARPNQKGIHL